MLKMKYIMYEKSEYYIFPELINHSDAAKGKCSGKPISAGFIDFRTEGRQVIANCYGNSTTLDLKSRGMQDSIIITQNLNGKIG